METKVRILERPELNNPLVICGLPGSGYVGKMAVDHLISELKAKKMAEFYSYSFPPQVIVKKAGYVDMVKNELYYWKDPSGRRDLLLYGGDAQPVSTEAEYELSDIVTDLVKELGAKRLFTLAAYVTGSLTSTPRVFGTATDEAELRELEKHNVIPMAEGNITGMNGLLVGFAKLKDMVGICLLGETSGYILDAKAAQAVLRVLLDIIGMRISFESLDRKAMETSLLIKNLKREMERKGGEKKEDLGYIS